MFITEGSESGSSSDDEDLDEEGEGEEGAVVEWIPSGPHRALGDWEKYTTVSIGRSVSFSLLIACVCF